MNIVELKIDKKKQSHAQIFTIYILISNRLRVIQDDRLKNKIELK